MKKNKGFTLIELLVVIAIIGVLSSVVFVSLNSARNKAKDSTIKATLSNMRSQVATYYDNNGYGNTGRATFVPPTGTPNLFYPYGGYNFCEYFSSTLSKVAVDAQQDVYCTVMSDYDSYEIDTILSNGSIFCVDSDGFSGIPSGTPVRALNVKVHC